MSNGITCLDVQLIKPGDKFLGGLGNGFVKVWGKKEKSGISSEEDAFSMIKDWQFIEIESFKINEQAKEAEIKERKDVDVKTLASFSTTMPSLYICCISTLKSIFIRNLEKHEVN